MALTATQQRNAVSEGSALGLVMCDRLEIGHDKTAIDLSFTGAWRAWSLRSRFPQVTSDLAKGSDGTRVLTRATERKRTWNLYWDSSGATILIRPRPQWADATIDATAAAESIDGKVPAGDWRELAEEFLARLDR